MDEAWDCLIVLDACRYDYFEKFWPDYFTGDLSKRLSAGTSTVDWRDNSFPARYEDVTYVSSNPYINSVVPVRGFLGSDHFGKVVDVWSTGWDEPRGTVLPETVTDAAISALMRADGGRIIVHYLQPHAPYLSLDLAAGGFPMPDLASNQVLSGTKAGKGSRARRKIHRLLTAVTQRAGLMGQSADWRLRELLRMEPASPMDAVRRKYGDDGLREAYAANLVAVLKQVSTLLKYVEGVVVITADHGELLGEGGCYSHWAASTNSYLLEIPWLVIERSGQDNASRAEWERKREAAGHGETSGDEDEAAIKSRLKALGYVDE
jgi:hypothetical protein